MNPKILLALEFTDLYMQCSFDLLFMRFQHIKVVHRIFILKKVVHGSK